MQRGPEGGRGSSRYYAAYGPSLNRMFLLGFFFPLLWLYAYATYAPCMNSSSTPKSFRTKLKACLVMGVAFILLLIAWFVVATVAKQTGASWIDRFYGSISRLLA